MGKTKMDSLIKRARKHKSFSSLFLAYFRFIEKGARFVVYRFALFLFTEKYIARFFRSLAFHSSMYQGLAKRYLNAPFNLDGISHNMSSFKYQFQFLIKDTPGKKIDPQSVYPASDDETSFLGDFSQTPQIFVGIANLSCLDVLVGLKPEFILLSDANYSQVLFLDFIIYLLKISKTRAEFLANLFQKNEAGIESLLRRIKTDNALFLENDFWNIEKQKRLLSYKDKRHQLLHNEFLSYGFYRKEKRIKGVVHQKMGQTTFGGLEKVVVSLFLKKEHFKELEDCYFTVLSFVKKEGFLWSKENYKKTKELFEGPYVLSWTPLSFELVSQICVNFRYFYKTFWLSNLITLGFLDRSCGRMAFAFLLFKYLLYDPGLIIVSDRREPFFKKDFVLPEPHWHAFNVISKHIARDRNYEIVVSPKKGDISTFKNCKQISSNDFLDSSLRAECLILHILGGNGVDFELYSRIIKKSLKDSKIVIILEHNKNSKDFEKSDLHLLSLEDIMKIAGRPEKIEHSFGFKDKKRNLILVYSNE